MNRKDYTRLIHIARNQCTRCPACGKLRCREEEDGVAVCGDCGIAMEPLSEDHYRQLLRTVAGADSCRFLDEAGLEKVYALFTSCGFRPRTGGGVDRVERDWQEGRRRTMAVIVSEAKRTLGPSWQHRLNAFVASKNDGETRLHRLSDSQLRQVVGWIRREGSRRSSNGYSTHKEKRI